MGGPWVVGGPLVSRTASRQIESAAAAPVAHSLRRYGVNYNGGTGRTVEKTWVDRIHLHRHRPSASTWNTGTRRVSWRTR